MGGVLCINLLRHACNIYGELIPPTRQGDFSFSLFLCVVNLEECTPLFSNKIIATNFRLYAYLIIENNNL